MPQRAAFFDVDGTLTKTNVWRHFIAYFRTHHTKKAAHLLFTALHYPLYWMRKIGLTSESAFRAAWAEHLAWYLRGENEAKAQLIWQWIIRDMEAKRVWRDDVIQVLQEHLAKGDLVVLVSSGPQPLIQAIGEALGAHHAVGTMLETKRGVFTGRSLKPVCIDQHKAELARAYLKQSGKEVDFQHSYAYADSVTDIGLFELVGHPIAVYPDEELRKIAVEAGWSVLPRFRADVHA